MNLDQYQRRIFDENELCNILYQNPTEDFKNYTLENNEKHNAAIRKNYSDLAVIDSLADLTESPEIWHRNNQKKWHMPDEYKNFDIAKWVLDQCSNEAELQRAGYELLEYAEKNLLDMLCYLKYFVDTMQKNHVIWGIGRGSSVASFVLYKIGIHQINSLYYDLDFHEFMR